MKPPNFQNKLSNSVRGWDDLLPIFSKRPSGFPVLYDQISISMYRDGELLSREHAVFRIDVVAQDTFVLNRWFVLPFGWFKSAYDVKAVRVSDLTSVGDVSNLLSVRMNGYKQKAVEGVSFEYGFSGHADNYLKRFFYHCPRKFSLAPRLTRASEFRF